MPTYFFDLKAMLAAQLPLLPDGHEWFPFDPDDPDLSSPTDQVEIPVTIGNISVALHLVALLDVELHPPTSPPLCAEDTGLSITFDFATALAAGRDRLRGLTGANGITALIRRLPHRRNRAHSFSR